MATAKIKFIGKENYTFRHGSALEEFAPGDVREVSEDLATILLREEALERRWKKDETLRDERLVPLFESASGEKAGKGDVITMTENTTGETE